MGSSIARRSVMRAAGGFLAACAIPAHGNAAPLGFDPASAADRALAFRKLAWSMDDKVTYSWLRGRRYGLHQGKLYPFWDMVVGTMFRVLDHGDGRYDVISIGASFYTDVQTGRMIDTFDNPLTGKRARIGFFPPSPQTISYGPAGRIDTPKGVLAGLARTVAIGPAWAEGNDVFVIGDTMLHGALHESAVHVNDLDTYAGSLRDVLDPAQKNPPARMMFNDLNTWPSWLEMGDIEGTYFSRALGRKVFALSDMPALWQAEMTRRLPQIARDPVGLLKG
jgi:hypothetical protein